MSKIPTTMLAAAIDRLGGLEVLTLHTLPVPVVEASEVRAHERIAAGHVLGKVVLRIR